MRTRLSIGLVASLLALAGCAATPRARAPHGLDAIQTVVVIYAENRSFDNLYGTFPNANGLAGARFAPQVDHDGTPLPRLPAIPPDPHSPGTSPFYGHLPNAPFRVDAPPLDGSLATRTRDLVHKFYQNQEQIDGGLNDRFAAVSNAGGLTMGHYDGSSLPMWQWARRYTLADHFFQGAFGGSFLNHQWLICACTPTYPDAPVPLRALVDARGRLVRTPDSPKSALDGPPTFARDGTITPDGYIVNTSQPPYQPSGIRPAAHGDPRLADASRCASTPKASTCPVPPQTQRTIGDALSAKGISWAWYAEGWDAALADPKVIYDEDPSAAVNFQPHHQPFNYFAAYAPGTAARAEHLKDGAAFLDAVDRGAPLPAVSFLKPQGRLNEHPGYASVLDGDRHIADIVGHLTQHPQWPHMAIFVLYDENGGWWDHVAPPSGDRWGPGSRIPAIVISPFAGKGRVDHTPYDTTSVLKFLVRRFDLEPLPGVRPNVGDLTAAFDFGS